MINSLQRGSPDDVFELGNQVIDSANQGILVCDLNLRVKIWNPFLENLTGIPAVQVLGKKVEEKFPFEGKSDVYRGLIQALLGQTISLEHPPSSTQNGKSPWALCDSYPLLDSNGEIKGAVGIFREFATPQTLSKNSQQTQEFKAGIFNSISSQVAVLDKHGKILVTNSSWERFVLQNHVAMGIPAEEILTGANYLDFCTNANVESLRYLIKIRGGILEIIEGGKQNFSMEYPLSLAGEKLWLLISASPMDVRGASVVVTQLNITDRVVAQQALKDEKSLYLSLVEHLPQSIFRKNREGVYLYVNEHYCEWMGKTALQLLGKTVFDLYERDVAEAYAHADQMVISKGENFEEIQEFKSGPHKRKISHLLKSPIRSASGEIIGVQGIITDISKQTELETKYLRAQRMDNIGSLAIGIAHDLNNILAPIVMSTSLLNLERSREERKEIVSLIEMSAHRAVGIVRQLLTMGRGEDGKKSTFQPRHIIREVCKIIRETFPRSIQIEEESESDLGLVSGDATQLHQVLLNLCLNARDAMPAGGRLILRARNIFLDENRAAQNTGVAPGQYIRIQVQDTGEGIPESAREHIFESFFTTKSPEKGSGLGLTTVLGIVKNHRGFVSFTSMEGQGTTFEVFLPAITDAAEEMETQPAALTAIRQKGGLILLVDDEPAIRMALSKILKRAGYSVLEARNGTDAIAQFTLRQTDIKAVVADFMMPQMDGVMLCRTLKRLSPRMPVIVSSGGLMSPESAGVIDAFADLGVRHVLHKPHKADVLLEALHETLNPTPTE